MEKKENPVKEKIRVLVADDSFFMKKLLREIMERDSRIEVVDEARDGEEAVQKIIAQKPRVVTLDYNMPKMNGFEVVNKVLDLVRENPPAILMLSAHTDKNPPITWECLRAGAVDFIAKPSGELSLDIDKIKDEIISKIVIASQSKVKISPRVKLEWRKEEIISPKKTIGAEKIVVIGSSTGGPPIVEEILTDIPADFKASLIVVQHMPPFFTSRFAQRLNEISSVFVKEAHTGSKILERNVLVAPSVSDIKIKKDGIYLVDNPNFQGARPCIDSVMVSAAKVFKANAVGVILSGMGKDGLAGAREIKKQGGYVIVQSPATTVIDSMPNSVLEAGLADEVLSPGEIGKRIVELAS